jgi:hypothetical protein
MRCTRLSGRHHTVRVAALGALLIGGAPGYSQVSLRPFSADQTHTVGKKTTNAKVYATEKAIRTEGEDAKGKKSISILRFDRKIMWILMPGQQMYLEMPAVGAGISELARDMEGADVQRQPLGTEQVGSYLCDKYRVQVNYQSRTYTSIEWAAKELDGFVVKKQGEKAEWSTEFRNVHLASQDPSLFEIPTGYQKFNLGFGRSGAPQN